MPTQIERFEGLANHLLDDFLSLRERYAILAPIIFDKKVAHRHAAGKRLRGFKILRRSLFLTCVQDIVKLTCDTDERAPSIHNIVSDLKKDAKLLRDLKNRFLLKGHERVAQFDDLYRELILIKERLDASPVIHAFRRVRNKITAHTEVRYVADKYQRFDLGSLGIKWRDLSKPIPEMQRAVELIGAIVRNTSFAWDVLDEQLSFAADAFWNTSDSIG